VPFGVAPGVKEWTLRVFDPILLRDCFRDRLIRRISHSMATRYVSRSAESDRGSYSGSNAVQEVLIVESTALMSLPSALAKPPPQDGSSGYRCSHEKQARLLDRREGAGVAANVQNTLVMAGYSTGLSLGRTNCRKKLWRRRRIRASLPAPAPLNGNTRANATAPRLLALDDLPTGSMALYRLRRQASLCQLLSPAARLY